MVNQLTHGTGVEDGCLKFMGVLLILSEFVVDQQFFHGSEVDNVLTIRVFQLLKNFAHSFHKAIAGRGTMMSTSFGTGQKKVGQGRNGRHSLRCADSKTL